MMLDRILVEIDDSKEGARTLQVAIELARKVGSDLKAIIVQRPLPYFFSFAVSTIFADMWKRAQNDRCAALYSKVRAQMTRAGIYPDIALVSGEEVRSIVECANRYGANLVIMARRRSVRIDYKTQDVADRVSCGVLGVP